MTYSPGQQVAHYTVQSTPRPDGPRPPRYKVKCQCGNASEISERALKNAQDGRSKNCRKCYVVKAKMTDKTKRRNCLKCSDCPALRPYNGSECECGLTRNDRGMK